MQCYGGHCYDPQADYKPNASSGTIYFQGADEPLGRGTVLIDNGGRTYNLSYGVQYPVLVDGDSMESLSRATFVVQNGGTLTLTNDCTVGELEVSGTYSRVYLNGHTLTVRSRKHASSTAPGYKGYPVGTVIPGDGGRIFFPPKPLAIILR